MDDWDDDTDIYEVSMFGNMCYWVSKEEYSRLVADLKSGESYMEFITTTGMEVVLPKEAICDLNHSTAGQRRATAERTKKYEEYKQRHSKKEWEE